jgi:hypothetical protein
VAINGTLVGYFEGRKGLREGDPPSPYVFVIAMEVLSNCKQAEIAMDLRKFDFHPYCSKLQMHHICFADDLFIFSATNLKSVGTLENVLDDFADLSRFVANPSKSLIFCSSVDKNTEEQILMYLHMKEGRLLVRHLEVSLISTKLTSSYCDILIGKVAASVDFWFSKHLSFSGRLQLITSILYSL